MTAGAKVLTVPRRIDGGAALLAVCGVLAAALVLLRQTHFGPGLTPDSAAYLSVARNLARGDGLVPCYGDFVHYPPLFPAMLALAGQFTDDLITAGAMFNALCFGGCVVLVGRWARRRCAA